MAEEIVKEEKVKEEETKDVSTVMKLTEMTEAMEQSKLNLNNVIDEQEYLVTHLENTKDEKFTKLVNSMKVQIVDLKSQDKRLEDKITKMKTVIAKAEAEKDFEDFLDTFVYAIGMFDNM